MKKLMQSKPTLSVGIPAYNEEGNIRNLLFSVLRQRQVNFKLEKIYVVCDGCTDKTVEIAQSMAEKHQLIKIISAGDRKGKAAVLNKIYKLHNSDYLLTLDADIVFEGDSDLEQMIKLMLKHPEIDLTGPRHKPVWPKSLWGKFATVSYLSFEEAFLKWKNGNNYYAVMGAHLLRGQFSKSFTYPKNTISDQCYLWSKATRGNPKGFKLCKESFVLFRPVSTFRDWRLLGVRSVFGDKADLVKHFGEKILNEVTIPKLLVYQALVSWLVRNPFYTLGSIIMNIYIRKFPYKKMSLDCGIWETTSSSKVGIEAGL